MNRSAFQSLSWWVGIVILGSSIIAILTALEWEYETKLFPISLAGFMVLISLIHTVLGLMPDTSASAVSLDTLSEPASRAGKFKGDSRDHLRYFAWLGVLMFLVYVFGFPVGLPLFTVTLMAMHRVSWLIFVPVAFGIWAFAYLLMFRALGVAGPAAAISNLW